MSFNPQHIHECEKEKEISPRKKIDAVMIVVGLAASISSVPQVYKIFQTGDVAGISLLTQVIGLISVLTWFSYGLYIKNKPLMITTSVTTIVLLVVIVQIILYQ